MIYDSGPAEIEKERNTMNIANNSEAIRNRALNAEPNQLSF